MENNQLPNLVLHLKKEYFEQIKAGEKLEEYRLVTEYWKKRLEGRNYGQIILLCGYPKRGDEANKITRPWRGFEVKTICHKHFGDAPVNVFAIRL